MRFSQRLGRRSLQRRDAFSSRSPRYAAPAGLVDGSGNIGQLQIGRLAAGTSRLAAVTIARHTWLQRGRLRAEDTKELLLNESKHRINNTLATVQIRRPDKRCATACRLATARPSCARQRAAGEANDLPLTVENCDQAPLGEVVSAP